MKRACLAAFAAALSFITVSKAPAAVLDQFQLDGTEQNQAIHSIRPVGQTFTAGITGTLSSIELSLFESGDGGDLFLEILDFSGGDLTTAPSLGSVSIAEGDLGPSPQSLLENSVTATLFDLSGLGIDVMAGSEYAFRLTSPRVLENGVNLYAIRTAIFSDFYTDGAYFVGTSFTGGDAAFKISVAPIPLPAGLWLMLGGMAGLLALRRKSKP